jgi:hypothetical protein
VGLLTLKWTIQRVTRVRKEENKKGQFQFNYHNSGRYPLACILFKTRHFGEYILSPYRWNLLRWAHWKELVSCLRTPETTTITFTNPTQHKPQLTFLHLEPPHICRSLYTLTVSWMILLKTKYCQNKTHH